MDGILVVDKPQGWTSHDVVDFIRKRFGLKKVGHAGTLDPMATGVLVIMIGSFTKSSSLLSADDKEYEGALTLGAESDTGDAEGRITDSGKPLNFLKAQIEDVFNKFLGEIEQRPPNYSAIKIKGVRRYKLARRGIEVQPLPPRKICIKNIEVTGIRLPVVYFKVTCSKGTYVRSLAADIGNALGCGAYLSRLKRTRSGRFGIDKMISIDALKVLDQTGLKDKLL